MHWTKTFAIYQLILILVFLGFGAWMLTRGSWIGWLALGLALVQVIVVGRIYLKSRIRETE